MENLDKANGIVKQIKSSREGWCPSWQTHQNNLHIAELYQELNSLGFQLTRDMQLEAHKPLKLTCLM